MIRAPEPVVLPEQPAVTPQLTDLLTRLLDKNPATRISLVEVRRVAADTPGGAQQFPCMHSFANRCCSGLLCSAVAPMLVYW
jgi:hypothetical protein